ncbi:MAG: hypothetical protein HYT70_02345 [Candidatus Aenigmarchaeota archaeon]|nr:hypothetical protein [Candidatus Aenigmarchaeota archaeon]
MVYLAIISLIAYAIGVFLFAVAIYFNLKKDKEKYRTALKYSLYALFLFISALILSIITNDPIPYFNVLMIVGVFTFGIAFPIIFPTLIANEVKRELGEKEEIHYRKLSENEAKEEISEYLKHKKGNVWIEDVINDLKIEPEIVVKIIKVFHKKNKIKEV